MRNQKRKSVIGTLKVVCLGVVLLVGIGPQIGGFISVSHAAPAKVQSPDAKVVKEKNIRAEEERALKRQNRRYMKQATRMERQYRRRAAAARNTAERGAMLAIAEYWKAESALAR